MRRLLLVDGHSNLYRAFYAIRTPLAAPDGTPTTAVYGFLRMLHKLLRQLEPTHVAVAFDVGAETFRTRLDATYKAHRPAMPDDLAVQIPIVQEALAHLGVTVLTVADVEADDVIGTLAVRAAAADFEVIVASTDKDLMQLVRDPAISMWHTRDERRLDERAVEERFGVPPRRVVDVLSLMGDSSDNVPGCPGIGEKTAKDLIRHWGGLDELFAHVDEIAPPRARRALAEHREAVELARRLVTIDTAVALDTALDGLARGNTDTARLAELYRKLGFDSLLAELSAPPSASGVSHAEGREASVAELATAMADSAPRAFFLGVDSLAVAFDDGVLLSRHPDAVTVLADASNLAASWCWDSKALLNRLLDAGKTTAELPRDAMLAGYLLAPDERVTLDAVCQRHGVGGPRADSPIDAAAALARLGGALAPALEREGLVAVFADIEMPVVPVLADMERRGIALDVAVLADLSTRLDRSLAELEVEIRGEAGVTFNINSPQQLAEVLFARRGLPVLRRTAKTRAPSTDADVLAELAARGHRLPGLILDYREQAKLKSTYVDALPRQVAADGRIHTRFNQAVAATGRLSSSDPNLQNIPVRTDLGREVRRAFVAGPGLTLITADYSQIELRVLAHLADEPALIAAFSRGEDIHRATAALVLGATADDVTDAQRRAAKTVNFGVLYGMSAFSLGRELGVETHAAQEFIDAYFARLPRVRAYLEAIKDEARRSGKVRTMFGRVRWIAGIDARNPNLRGNAERQAINAPIQGTAADLMKLAMIRVQHDLAAGARPAYLLLQVHDELVLETAPDSVATLAPRLRHALEGVASLAVPLRVDIDSGRSWADAKG